MSDGISMTDTGPLHTIQRWMQAVITHPDGVAEGVVSHDAAALLKMSLSDLEQVIRPSAEMGSLERLAVYGRAYFGRLIECLQAQFPAVRKAVGDEAFDALAFGYLVEHPSKGYSLSTLSDSFEAYLSAVRPERSEGRHSSQPDFGDFVIELARLERIYNDVFDGPGPERSASLSATDFAGLSATTFAESRLRLHGCVRLLSFQFPVHEYATSIRHGQEAVSPDPRPVYLVVTRRDYLVRRFEVTRAQFEILAAIEAGCTIGTALEAAVNVSGTLTPLEIQEWFRVWSAALLFAEIVRPSNVTDSSGKSV